MDRENTNKDKAYLNYITVVCKPFLTTLMILLSDDDVHHAIFKDGLDKNKKSLEQTIDDSSSK